MVLEKFEKLLSGSKGIWATPTPKVRTPYHMIMIGPYYAMECRKALVTPTAKVAAAII